MRTGGRRGRNDSGIITAAEIACFAYCPESWRLQHGLGLTTDNQAALDRGIRHHDRKATSERLAGRAILLGQLLAFLAGLGLLWLLVGDP